MEIYYEVTISPHHGGFGMYQLGEHNYSPQMAWALRSDLEDEISSAAEFLPIDAALADSEFQAAGIEDIRGRIYGGDPAHLYAVLDADPEGKLCIYYFGIEAAQVPENYFEE